MAQVKFLEVTMVTQVTHAGDSADVTGREINGELDESVMNKRRYSEYG